MPLSSSLFCNRFYAFCNPVTILVSPSSCTVIISIPIMRILKIEFHELEYELC
jgi:hypothetical protein